MKRAVLIVCAASFALCASFARGAHESTAVSLKKPDYGEGGGAGVAVPNDIQLEGIAGQDEATRQTALTGTLKVKGKGDERHALLKTKSGTYTLVLSELDADAIFALKGKRLSVSGVFAGSDMFILGAYELVQ